MAASADVLLLRDGKGKDCDGWVVALSAAREDRGQELLPMRPPVRAEKVPDPNAINLSCISFLRQALM